MGLGAILNTFKHKEKAKGIKTKLDRYLLKRTSTVDIGRPYEDERKMSVHHPSALSSEPCDRKLVYDFIQAEKTDGGIEPRIRRLFNVGHDNGYRIQGYFYEMGILLGKWHCVICGYTWLDMENPSPDSCPSCRSKLNIWYNLHYLEVPIYDNKCKISGSADGVLKREWGRQLFELKTIKNKPVRTSKYGNYFEDLQGPLDKHRLQANYYLCKSGNIYGRETEDDFKHGLIIYSSKNDQRIKEFTIMAMEEEAKKIEFRAALIDGWLEDKELPLRIYELKSKPPCSWCSYKKLCWETEKTFNEVENRGRS